MTSNIERGEALRHARLALDKTQKEIAGAARVSERTVLRLEQGSEASLNSLLSVCAVLGVDPSSLTADDERQRDDEIVTLPRGDQPGYGSDLRRTAARVWALPVGYHAFAACFLVVLVVAPFYAAVLEKNGRWGMLWEQTLQTANVVNMWKATTWLANDAVDGLVTPKVIEDAFDPVLGRKNCDSRSTLEKVFRLLCPFDAASVRIVSQDSHGFRIVVGPMDRLVFDGVLAVMPSIPDLKLTVAIVDDPDGDPERETWIDPSGRRSGLLRDFADGNWMAIDARHTEVGQ